MGGVDGGEAARYVSLNIDANGRVWLYRLFAIDAAGIVARRSDVGAIGLLAATVSAPLVLRLVCRSDDTYTARRTSEAHAVTFLRIQQHLAWSGDYMYCEVK